MNRPDLPQNDDTPQLPEPLRRDLAKLTDARVFVPDAIDQSILAEARAALGQARHRRRLTFVRRVGIAAAIALTATVTWLVWPEQHQPARVSPQLADLNADGQVNIVDAFLLARQLDQSQPQLDRQTADVNRDGRIDRQDVQAIATMAVKLNTHQGGPS